MKHISRLLFIVLYLFVLTNAIYSQWAQTDGPYTGAILSLAVSGTNLFAGSANGSVFSSTINTTNWTQTILA